MCFAALLSTAELRSPADEEPLTGDLASPWKAIPTFCPSSALTS